MSARERGEGLRRPQLVRRAGNEARAASRRHGYAQLFTLTYLRQPDTTSWVATSLATQVMIVGGGLSVLSAAYHMASSITGLSHGCRGTWSSSGLLAAGDAFAEHRRPS